LYFSSCPSLSLFNRFEIKFFIVFSIFLRITAMTSFHPIFIVISISLQSIILRLILFLVLPSPWLSITLFIIFIGGLIIIFLYVASLASNERFGIFTQSPLPWIKLIFFSLTSFTIISYTLINYDFNKILQISFNPLIFKIYLTQITPIISFSIVYLLLTLIICVNLTHIKSGPIRHLSKS